MAWLDGWKYRKAIVIAHTADGAQTNYQMKLLVGESSGATGEQVDCGANVASDFDDLRFTTSDGTTLCDYWIESLSGSTPNQLATVWIEVPTIAAHPDDTTIYMYYGGTTTAVSNGPNTFLFHDHFDGTLTDQWMGDTSHCTVASSIVTLTANAATHHMIYTKTGYSNNVAMRASAQLANADYNYLFLSDKVGTGGTGLQHNSASTNHSDWVTYDGTLNVWNNTAIGFDSYHIYDIVRLTSGTDTVKVYQDGTEIGSGTTTNIPTGSLNPQLQACNNAAAVSADWVLVRNITYNPPTWSSFGAQESFYLNRLSPYVHILAH